MAEDISNTFQQYLGAVRRRRVAGLVALAAGVIATLLLAFLLPARYQSTATILIEQQEVPTDLVRSAITSYADQRIQVISQRVMTTQNLLDIVRRYGLYPEEQVTDSRESLVQQMRDDVDFRMISADVIDPRSGMPREATIAFAVSYSSVSPDLAAKVANELTTLYLNENLTSRTRLAQDAAGFLQAEGDRLSKEIAALEAKLATFKQANTNRLPELTQLNYQLLDRTEQELRLAESQLSSLDQQRVFLEAQLVQIKPNSVLLTETGERILSSEDRLKVLRSQLASARALYSAGHPDIVRIEREIAGLESQADAGSSQGPELARRVERTRTELAEASQRYTADHPDVLRLTRDLEALEGTLQANPAPTTPRPAPRSPDNPAYVQLQAQLSATVNDQAALGQRIAAMRAQVAEYENHIRNSPQIEREYSELTRDYANAQAKYQEIRSKSMEAQVSQNLETDRKGERFTLIEPPLPPQEPVSPNRPAVLAIGLLLSLLIAAGSIALREVLDSTVRGRADLLDILDAPPLASVPRIFSQAERVAARKRVRWSLTSATAGLFSALVAVHLLVRPIDMIWMSGLRRFGLM